mgnify:CR=1 FL=1
MGNKGSQPEGDVEDYSQPHAPRGAQETDGRRHGAARGGGYAGAGKQHRHRAYEEPVPDDMGLPPPPPPDDSRVERPWKKEPSREGTSHFLPLPLPPSLPPSPLPALLLPRADGSRVRSWGFAGRERDGGHGDGRYEQSRAPRDVGGRRQGGHASTSTGRASRQQSQALSEAMEMANTMSSQPGAAQAGWQDSRSGSAYSDGGRPPFRRSRSGGSRRCALCLCLSLLL